MVNYELRGSVAIISMDDGKVNALNYESIDALMQALERAESEASTVVFAGRAGRFSAGFDLKLMMAGPDAAVNLLRKGCDLFMRLYSFPLPTIIACTGHAVAGGVLLVLCGDYRIGINGDFKLGLNEVAIRMPLPVLALEMARARLSPQALTQATLCAQLYDPAAAVQAGYLDEVVDPDTILEAALAQAEAWDGLDRNAFALSKQTLRQPLIDYIWTTLDDDMARFTSPAP